MKKILLFICFVISIDIVNAQITQPASPKLTDKELGLQYLQTSRSLKVAGWSMLGVGLILTTIAVNQQANDIFNENTGAETLSVVGSLLIVGSIPCFIAGAKNKGRAEILLRNENIMVWNRPNSLKSYPALSLAINF